MEGSSFIATVTVTFVGLDAGPSSPLSNASSPFELGLGNGLLAIAASFKRLLENVSWPCCAALDTSMSLQQLPDRAACAPTQLALPSS